MHFKVYSTIFVSWPHPREQIRFSGILNRNHKVGMGWYDWVSGGKFGRNSEVNMIEMHCAKFSKNYWRRNYVKVNLEILQCNKYSLET